MKDGCVYEQHEKIYALKRLFYEISHKPFSNDEIAQLSIFSSS